jgi:hypothetical protein
VAEAFEMFTDTVLVVRNESQRSQPKAASRQNLALEFSIPKQNALTDMHFSAGPNQSFPSAGTELASKKDLNLAAEMLGAGSTGRSLRMNPGSPPEQAGRDDERIVEHEQFVAAKKTE